MSTIKVINAIHPTGSTNNIVLDASGNVTVGNNLTVTGTTTMTGAATVGGVAVVAVAPGSSGNVLTSNGTAWTSATPAAGGFSNAQFFTASGTFTIPAGITKVKVTVVGGGGGGGGNGPGSGGGAGGVAIKYITGLTPGGTVSVTVGNGGAGGATAGQSGATGGTSSFGAYCSATGGSGGASSAAAPGAGGTGSSGDLNLQGGYGMSAYNYVDGCTTVTYAGPGGTNMFGGAGSPTQQGGFGTGYAGRANTGAGGAGTKIGFDHATAGGSGLVIVEY